MSLMLPSLNSSNLSLADVLPSCFASLSVSGCENRLDLPTVRSSIVILVDGMGFHNLKSAQAHARFLSQNLSEAQKLTTVFPSTTASALASLTTGTSPGTHGLTGYVVKDPQSGKIFNQLTGLGQIAHPDEWMRVDPLYSRATAGGVSATVASHPRFESTPLTQLIHAGADFVGGKSLQDRVAHTLKIVKKPGRHFVLLYISELDELAHKQGVGSAQWAGLLETLDQAVKELVTGAPSDCGIFLTADHGVLDVPATRHYLFGNDVSHMKHIEAVGGEPRCLQLFFTENSSTVERCDAVARWREDWSELAWVMTKGEVIKQGLYGNFTTENMKRLGDIFVLAKKNVVFYDERDLTLKGRAMVGQHGGVSESEMVIPAIRLGGYA
jgi:hypothetical protein